MKRTFRNGTFEVVRASKITSGKGFGKVLWTLRADDGTEWVALGKPGRERQLTAKPSTR